MLVWAAAVAAKYDEISRTEARHVSRRVDDAEHVVVSFGTTGAFVDYVVDELRTEGHRVGTFRPVTLWPFPSSALAEAAGASQCTQVLVYELNAGQMVDDVRLAVNGAVPVHSIGGVSQDESGMRQGDLLGVETIRARLLAAMKEAR